MRNFFAMVSRIKYINRWGLMNSVRRENLSEHTLETAMLVHGLVAIGNNRLNENLNAETAVMIAMYHDCSEIITGDLPTPVKYKTPSIIEAYKDIEKDANKRLLSMLPTDLMTEYEKYFMPEENFPQYIPYIKAADKISALIKCLEEEKSGNSEFQNAKKTIMKSEALKLPAAVIFLEEFLPAYSMTLDDILSL